jgi:hypothetical protein
MRVSSRSTILLLASTFALAPVLAVADKTPPKAGPKASTKEALHRKVGTVKIRDWKVQVEGTPVPDGTPIPPSASDFSGGREGLLQLLGDALLPCCGFHPAQAPPTPRLA